MARIRVPQAPARRGSVRAVEPRPRPIRPLNNLPLQLSSFIGREREIAATTELLSATRLLTLTGPGGIGNTRLALAVADALIDTFADGAWMVELAGVADASLVAATVAQVFGVEGETGTPLLDSPAEVLGDRSTLVLLDNCEHLIDACADVAGNLLRSCPEVRILATSREPLGVAGEHVRRVPPLGLPWSTGAMPLAQMQQSEAMRLFVERAQASRADFQLTERNAVAVAEVCRRLDGLPLTIELAAAHMRGMAPEQLLDSLDQRFRRLAPARRGAPERQRTLQATIDWSYGLLSEVEQTVFNRRGVFTRGWTIDAAEHVVSDAEHVLAEDVLPLRRSGRNSRRRLTRSSTIRSATTWASRASCSRQPAGTQTRRFR
jgi:predicted ATPase